MKSSALLNSVRGNQRQKIFRDDQGANNERAASPRDFIQERKAVGLKRAGRYGVGFPAHSHFI